MGTFTRDWDEANPTDSDYAYQIDDYMRQLREDVAERLEDMFYGFTAGENTYEASAKYLQLHEQASVSTPSSNYGRLYAKDVSGVAELHYLDDRGHEKQLTNGGKLNIAAADIAADLINETKIRLQNNANLTARNAAGDDDVNLIKANASDLVEIPDGAVLASSAAPTVDAGIANKKYVDDQVDTQNMTPSTYTGQESITFPNGAIRKCGKITQTGFGATITFDEAFPTDIDYAGASIIAGSGSATVVVVKSPAPSKTGFQVASNASGEDVYWEAWGH